MPVQLTKNSIDLGIVTRNPERMVAFYRDVLGYKPDGEMAMGGGGNMVRLLCGESLIKIVTPGNLADVDAPPGGIPGATGYRYFTMFVSNLEDIVQECTDAGSSVAVPPREIRPGVKIAIVTDDVTGDRDLLVGVLVHEHEIVAVLVEVLHLLLLYVRLTMTDAVTDLSSAAFDAWIYGLPLIEFAGTRHAIVATQLARGVTTSVNHLTHGRRLVNAKNRVVTAPNVDTLYSSAFIDLSAGPVTLTMPSAGDRYVSLHLMDAYTNSFCILGTRTTGPGGGPATSPRSGS